MYISLQLWPSNNLGYSQKIVGNYDSVPSTSLLGRLGHVIYDILNCFRWIHLSTGQESKLYLW